MWSSWHNERGNQLITKVITHEIRSFYALKHSWRVNQKSYSSFTLPIKQANAWSIIELILSLFWCFQYILILILLFFDFLWLFSLQHTTQGRCFTRYNNCNTHKKQLKRRKRNKGAIWRRREIVHAGHQSVWSSQLNQHCTSAESRQSCWAKVDLHASLAPSLSLRQTRLAFLHSSFCPRTLSRLILCLRHVCHHTKKSTPIHKITYSPQWGKKIAKKWFTPRPSMWEWGNVV